ncbi:MAG: GNAT family N-acetyltransferase [Phycisphaerales bacterium]
MSEFRYQPLGDNEGLRSAWARSGSLAFRNDPDTIIEYLNRVDRDRWCRVLLDEHGTLAATMMRSRIGMFICGQRVSAVSAGFVSVPPEQRGRRVSVALMHEHLREAHEERTALSVLYSARARLYRGVGYETAGRRSMIEVPIRSVGPRSLAGAEQVRVREMLESDLDAIKAFYTSCVRGFNGARSRRVVLGLHARCLRQEPSPGLCVRARRADDRLCGAHHGAHTSAQSVAQSCTSTTCSSAMHQRGGRSSVSSPDSPPRAARC